MKRTIDDQEFRTHNIYSPYPEEFNCQAVSIIRKYNFVPTHMAADNLLKEGRIQLQYILLFTEGKI